MTRRRFDLAPLYKALIDSGLGEGLTGAGIEDSLRQPMFTVGLKGIDAADAEKIEKLVDDTLARLATDGVDPATVLGQGKSGNPSNLEARP